MRIFFLCLLLYRNSRENFLGASNLTGNLLTAAGNPTTAAGNPTTASFGTSSVVPETVDWTESEARAAEELKEQECNAKRTEYQTQINDLEDSIKDYNDAENKFLGDAPDAAREECSSYEGQTQAHRACVKPFEDAMNMAKNKLCAVKENYNYLQNTCGGGVQHYNDKLNAQEQLTMERITC